MWQWFTRPPETEFTNPWEGRDNDPNTETAEPGRMRPDLATPTDYAVVYYEVLCDLSVQHGWGAMLTNDATEVVTLHEIGHQFGLTHGGGAPFPDDIMTPQSNEAEEALIHTIDPKFQPWALNIIRRHGAQLDPHP